ncbi:hypothetical protein JCM24511_09720 [Saitozyma sp. JCM 24511]|nr:hypothetical protein JCM24511_09720 [Saitozyma sp. JCM 24511]
MNRPPSITALPPPGEPHDEDPDTLKPSAVDPSASIDPHTGAVIGKKSAAERKFVSRLDAVLLVYTCISQVLKYLDQQNITNAYVSGLKEDLNIQGNQYNYFTTWFNVGYALFLIASPLYLPVRSPLTPLQPSQIIITRVRPSWWLPSLEFCWGCLTIGLSQVTNYKQIYVLRAFVGAFEASAYPGAIMLLMSWYTPREMALRIAMYHSCQSLGLMLSGALQTAIYESLNGHSGVAGWRWMFIVDGIMTVVWSLLGLVFIPDFPTKPNPWAFWLRPHHVEMARERTTRFRRTDNKKFTLKTIVRTLRQPLFYLFVALYPSSVLAQQGYNYFSLFLKALKNPDGTPTWSTAAVNAIPIGGAAIICVTVWVYGFMSDYFQTRWLIVMGQAIFALIPCIIMSIWNVPLGAKYFAYFASYLSVATAPPLFAWLSDCCPHDAEQRAFILGFSIAFYYAVALFLHWVWLTNSGAWSNVLIWPTVEVPHYLHAWQTCIALWVLVIILLCALRYTELKYIR